MGAIPAAIAEQVLAALSALRVYAWSGHGGHGGHGGHRPPGLPPRAERGRLIETARLATYRKSRPGPVGVEVTERILWCNPGRMA